jgi:hypothetical protein
MNKRSPYLVQEISDRTNVDGLPTPEKFGMLESYSDGSPRKGEKTPGECIVSLTKFPYERTKSELRLYTLS